jgi:folate-binding protein YgfZ
MIFLPYLSAARIFGPDAGSFLHTQLSADIAALEDSASTFATYCSVGGKVLALLLIQRINDEYLVIASSELLPSVLDRLKLYVLRAKVEMDLDPQMKISGLLPSESASVVISPGAGALRYTGESSNRESGEQAGQWKNQELLQGVCWLDSDSSEKFIPQMLGFDQIGAVSFSKGCYPGQEIIARTRYLGKVKRTPLIMTVEGSASIDNGARIQLNYGSETADGTLIDSAPAENQNTLLFTVTRTRDGERPDSISFNNKSYPVFSATM